MSDGKFTKMGHLPKQTPIFRTNLEFENQVLRLPGNVNIYIYFDLVGFCNLTLTEFQSRCLTSDPGLLWLHPDRCP